MAAARVRGGLRRVPASRCACLSWGGGGGEARRGAARRPGPGQAAEACAPRVLGLVWGRPWRSRPGPVARLRPPCRFLDARGWRWGAARAGARGPGPPRTQRGSVGSTLAAGPGPSSSPAAPREGDGPGVIFCGIICSCAFGFVCHFFEGGLEHARQAGTMGLGLLEGMGLSPVHCPGAGRGCAQAARRACPAPPLPMSELGSFLKQSLPPPPHTRSQRQSWVGQK